jgi:hypothetical protein
VDFRDLLLKCSVWPHHHEIEYDPGSSYAGGSMRSATEATVAPAEAHGVRRAHAREEKL